MGKSSISKNIKKRGSIMLGAMLGGAMGDIAEDLLIEKTPIDNSLIESGIIVAAGAGIASFPKNEGLITGFGYGMIGKGSSSLKDAAMEAFGADGGKKGGGETKAIKDPASPQLSMADVPTYMANVSDPASPQLSMAGMETVLGPEMEDVGLPYGMNGAEDGASPY